MAVRAACGMLVSVQLAVDSGELRPRLPRPLAAVRRLSVLSRTRL